MISQLLTQQARTSVGTCITSKRLYHVGKAGSVNTAIERGLRKSNGMGFRGKAKKDPNDSREKYRERFNIDLESYEMSPWKKALKERSQQGREYSKPRGGNFESKGRPDRKRPQHLERDSSLMVEDPERRGRFGETVRPTLRKFEYKDEGKGGRKRFGDRVPKNREDRDRRPSSPPFDSERPVGASLFSEAGSSRSRPQNKSFDREDRAPSYSDRTPFSRSGDEERSFTRKDSPRGGSFDRERPQSSRGERNFESSDGSRDFKTRDRSAPFERSSKPWEVRGSQSSERSFKPKGSSTPYERSPKPWEDKGKDGSYKSRIVYPTQRDESASTGTFKEDIDKRIPISIPYTTPASEFLYGTHVVEAALRSRKEPRRKLYKLYINSESEREDGTRDMAIVRLAEKNNVEIVHVAKNKLSMMDKMSAGRQHNGYILEASPLPRLPVLSLGTVEAHGFEITLDHQSKEEADINGKEPFIPVRNNPLRRNPLVLLLDSILDPGNLGGILRTASFLGVTAIAISTRNSASFTPVVLKASAGASENITIFDIKRPEGFIVNSQAQGWKVFAAVAPSLDNKNPKTVSISTERLGDPLSEDPCILMLGGEGDGLRWNLRSKADVELYIKGASGRLGVDSLNVSVAAGILCNSFTSKRGKGRLALEEEEAANAAVGLSDVAVRLVDGALGLGDGDYAERNEPFISSSMGEEEDEAEEDWEDAGENEENEYDEAEDGEDGENESTPEEKERDDNRMF